MRCKFIPVADRLRCSSLASWNFTYKWDTQNTIREVKHVEVRHVDIGQVELGHVEVGHEKYDTVMRHVEGG